MICTVHFKLNDIRVTRLGKAGINSIRDLYQVLDALDLQCVIELQAKEEPPLAPREKP